MRGLSLTSRASGASRRRFGRNVVLGVHSDRLRPTRAEGSKTHGSSTPVKQEGASTDLSLISKRLTKLVRPYWFDNPDANKPRMALAGVVILSLATTGISVVFNFLGRDFFNALSAKEEAAFYSQLLKYLAGFAVGIPVFVFRDYFMGLLSLRWREWMTEDMLGTYMDNKTFYNVHTGQVIDNPDQRLTADINNFTSASLSLAFTFLTSFVDLISFSGILFSIYPPLFAALVVYAVGGTAVSFYVGKKLVGLNFRQEAREADLRYGLVRVRENAESIAFYDGASSEVGLLVGRLGRVVANYRELLAASRNLDFFQSAYRYIIILLPAAVVAPLYFKGEIEFGVVNQSQSAFSHILADVSLVVYQFESLAGFSAVVDRLGEFQETVEAKGRFAADGTASDAATVDAAVPLGSEIEVLDSSKEGEVLVSVSNLTLCTPNRANLLVKGLDVQVRRGERLLIMGTSGCGKTSLLRALGGLWTTGIGSITRPPLTHLTGDGSPQGMMFVPQRPYMVLGSLRQQLLYPVFDSALISEALAAFHRSEAAAGISNILDPQIQPVLRTHSDYADPAAAAAVDDPDGAPAPEGSKATASEGAGESGAHHAAPAVPPPSDDRLCDALKQVGLEALLQRCADANGGAALDMSADWSTMLSLGEQQRLAFARVLLANPALVLLDESTSALDLENEARLYGLLQERGMAYVSVGHRTSLIEYHDRLLKLQGSSEPGTGAEWDVRDIGAQQVSVA